MRKLILYITTSLDGFIARENGDVDWLFSDQDYGYKDFTDSIDTVLMGGKTYRQVLDFGGEWPYLTKNSFVFTRDVSYQSNDEVSFIHHDPADLVRDLKHQEGKDIWLIGGGQINSIMLQAGLIDEIWLFLHPVYLGKGLPIFTNNALETWFTVHDIEEFDSGLVKIIYHARKDQ